MVQFLGVLFDGLAYGSLLFLISVGLSVTLGLMNFANLAHGAFAMLGGYLSVTFMGALGVPYLATLPLAFLGAALVGGLMERLLYRRLYTESHLRQVLFTIGLVFMSMAATTYIWGSGAQAVRLPQFLQGQVQVGGIQLGIFRLFMMATIVVIAVLLGILAKYTRFGAHIRAAVENRAAAIGMGIDVERVLCITFAFGSGLAGLGGALGIQVIGLDPSFPIKYLVYFLLVVVVGGAGTFKGPLIAAAVVGVVDTAGKYYAPAAGSFTMYALMIVLLLAFPAGFYGRRS